MFDDDTVTFQLAVMLRTMDINLSVDHSVKLEEEGYDLGALDQAVVESLIAQQDELSEEIAGHQSILALQQDYLEAREATIEDLTVDLDYFTDRLVEFTS